MEIPGSAALASYCGLMYQPKALPTLESLLGLHPSVINGTYIIVAFSGGIFEDATECRGPRRLSVNRSTRATYKVFFLVII